MKKRQQPERATAAEVLERLAAAGLDGHWRDLDDTQRAQLDAILAEAGMDHVALARARAAAIRAAAGQGEPS